MGKEEYKESICDIEKMYDENISLLYGVACKIVRDGAKADEVLKQTFEYVRENYSDFDESKQSLALWLVNVTRKIAHKKNSFQSFSRNQDSSFHFNSGQNNLSALSGNGNSLISVEQKKEVLDLIFFGGGNVNEVACRLGIDEVKVKQLLREAISHYRKEIQETQWK